MIYKVIGACALAVAGATTTDKWSKEGDLGDEINDYVSGGVKDFLAPTEVAILNNRGSIKYAFNGWTATNPPEASYVSIVSNERQLNVNSYFLSQKVVAGDADVPLAETFGTSLVYYPLSNGQEALVVSGNTSTTSTLYALTSLGYNRWATRQKITIDDTKGDLSFGNKLDISEDYTRLVASCATCKDGDVYVFEGQDNSWSQTAVLNQAGISLGFNDVGVSNDIVVGAGFTSSGDGVVSVFTKESNEWSQQQTLSSSSTHTIFKGVEIYEDTIALGYFAENPLATAVGTDFINIYESSPAVPGPKGRPKQWSLTQVLKPDYDATDPNHNFGNTFDIDGDNLLVSTRNADVYFFTRKNGFWSHQSYVGAGEGYTGDGFVALKGSQAVVGGTDGPIATTFFSNNADMACLQIEMGDRYGDGWGDVKLQVTTPDGESDFFSPSCSSPQFHRFRYCPSDSTKGGLYSVSITKSPKNRFEWEVFYQVYVEATDNWIVGDSETQMDFNFDSKHSFFEPLQSRKALPNNSTCVECEGYESISTAGYIASPRVVRELDHSSSKSKPKTRSPTISPAPTLTMDDTYSDYPNSVIMYVDVGDTWFADDHSGANFYISDRAGKKLVSSGTICGTATATTVYGCAQQLRDGDYTLRFSANLATETGLVPPLRNVHYCGIELLDNEELYFSVKEGCCVPYVKGSKSQFCTDNFATLLTMFIRLSGQSITSFSQDDKDVVFDALASSSRNTFIASDFQFVRVAETDAGSELIVTVNVGHLGGTENIASVVDTIESMFEANSKLVWESVVENAKATSELSGVTSLSFDEFKVVSRQDFDGSSLDSEAAFEMSSTSGAVNANEVSDKETLAASVVSYFGYVLAACSVLFVGYFVLQKKRSGDAVEKMDVEQK